MKFDKHGRAKIDKERRRRFVEDALKGLKSDPDCDYFYVSSGDSMGLALRIFEESGNFIETFDLKVRNRETVK